MFSLRPLLLMLLVLLTMVAEMRFDWMERAVGAYLLTTNPLRPESGAVWDQTHQTQAARKDLEQIVTDRQTLQREAREAEGFTEIAAGISVTQGVMLSAERFCKLFALLSPLVQSEIASPYELVGLFSSGRWVRTYFSKSVDALEVYLLDGQNRVLQQMRIPLALLPLMGDRWTERKEGLAELPEFQDRTYAPEVFFAALNSLPAEIRYNVVPDPQKLLNVPGPMVLAAISDEAHGGFIETAFQWEDGRVTREPGREWAVWHLRSILAGPPMDGDPDAMDGKAEEVGP